METEVHVYAFSIAANVLLSFFPFLIVMVSLCRDVLHWRGAEQAIYFALNDYFPDQVGTFISVKVSNIVGLQRQLGWVSILLLFFTANGIFEPLEVALNRAWGVRENRSYVKNQIVSLGMIFVCGGLVLLSTILTAANRDAFAAATGVTQFSALISVIFFKAAAVPLSILMLFLVYWLLPNRKVVPRELVLPAVAVGVLLEVLKFLNSLTWPWLREKLLREYGPFHYSVAIILWSFLAALVVLAGAEWTARRREES
jgi:YihY family inner membrane protein